MWSFEDHFSLPELYTEIKMLFWNLLKLLRRCYKVTYWKPLNSLTNLSAFGIIGITCIAYTGVGRTGRQFLHFDADSFPNMGFMDLMKYLHLH